MPLPRPSQNLEYVGWTELDTLLGIHDQLLILNARHVGMDVEAIDDAKESATTIPTKLVAQVAATKKAREDELARVAQQKIDAAEGR